MSGEIALIDRQTSLATGETIQILGVGNSDTCSTMINLDVQEGEYFSNVTFWYDETAVR